MWFEVKPTRRSLLLKSDAAITTETTLEHTFRILIVWNTYTLRAYPAGTPALRTSTRLSSSDAQPAKLLVGDVGEPKSELSQDPAPLITAHIRAVARIRSMRGLVVIVTPGN